MGAGAKGSGHRPGKLRGPRKSVIPSRKTERATATALVTDNAAFPPPWSVEEDWSDSMVLMSIITCPQCGHAAIERMPSNVCQIFYDCRGCGARLKAKPGDCCVFCSYGSVPCPTVQAKQADV